MEMPCAFLQVNQDEHKHLVQTAKKKKKDFWLIVKEVFRWHKKSALALEMNGFSFREIGYLSYWRCCNSRDVCWSLKCLWFHWDLFSARQRISMSESLALIAWIELEFNSAIFQPYSVPVICEMHKPHILWSISGGPIEAALGVLKTWVLLPSQCLACHATWKGSARLSK